MSYAPPSGGGQPSSESKGSRPMAGAIGRLGSDGSVKTSSVLPSALGSASMSTSRSARSARPMRPVATSPAEKT
eukprot:1736943-Prymnesium_polylepis.2